MFGHIIFDPPFPKEYILGLGGALALFTLLNYAPWSRAPVHTGMGHTVGRLRRSFLALFRLAVVAGLTIVLMRPMILEEEEVQSEKSVFTVLVDTSQSMNANDMGDPEGAVSRLQSVARELEKREDIFKQALRGKYSMRYFTFDEGLKPAVFEQLVQLDEGSGEKTDITTALINAANAYPDRKNAGILLVSDGRDNESGQVAAATAYLKAMGIPVWSTTVGTTQAAKDLWVTARINQNFLFVKQNTRLRVDLNQTGYTGWYAKVEAFREGESMGVQQVMLESGNEHITFPLREEVRGVYQYTVRVEPLRGEADPANNERSVFVRVVDEKARVLFVEAQPYWDSKFILRALQADPNLDVTAIFQTSRKRGKTFAITQKSADDGSDTTTTSAGVLMPRTKKELFKYDCVILGKDIDTVFSADELKLFKAYLEERGGSIVFARGKPYAHENETLASLEPLVWGTGAVQHVRLELTPAGAINPAFNLDQARKAGLIIRELPELVSITRVQKEKALAVVLARSDSMQDAQEIATIAYHRYGKGKVMSIGSSGLWKWSFLPQELDKYDAVYGRFWGQMMRWLIYGSDFLPGQDISFRTDRLTYDIGEMVPLVIQTKPEGRDGFRPRIEITPPNGNTVAITPVPEDDEPNLYAAYYLPDMQGEYSAVLYDGADKAATDAARFTVYSSSVERRYVVANPKLMQRVAETTGGACIDPQQWDELPERLETFELSARQQPRPEDCWDTLGVFGGLMALLVIEWLIRRRAGLV